MSSRNQPVLQLFRKEEKTWPKKVLYLSIGLALLVGMIFVLRREMKIDACLDGGGGWVYAREECDDAEQPRLRDIATRTWIRL